MHGTIQQREAHSTPAAEVPPGQLFGESHFDLRAALGVLRRRFWTVAITVVLVVAAAVVITLQLPKAYTATALVVVDSRDSQILGFQPGVGETAGNNTTIDTEVEIARSSKVLRRAAIELDVVNRPDFQDRGSALDMVAALFGLSESQDTPSGASREFSALSSAAQAKIIEQFSKAVSIGRLGVTNVIEISATMSSPEEAALAANTLADVYLAEQIEAKLSSNERAAAFLQDRVANLAADIAAGETQLDNFVQTKIAELGSPAARDLLSRLAEEERRRSSSGATLADIQAALDARNYMTLAQIDRAREAGLADRRAELLAQLQSGDGAALESARQELDALEARLRDIALSQARALQDQIIQSNATSSSLRDQLGRTLADLELPKDVSVELFQLQQSLSAKRALYESYIAKLQQVEQQTDFTIPDSRVIAPAEPPARASFPPSRLIVAGALVLALITGIGLAFIREHFVGGITTAEQLEGLSGVPVVAAVPKYSGTGARRPDLAIVTQPFSAYAESVRRIQLGMPPFLNKSRRCVFITSAVPGEGKTTIALSLARQSATTGASTVVIDADLRRARVRAYLGDPEVDRGLISFLSDKGGTRADDISIISEPSSGVNFILSEKASTGSTDTLLMSSRFDELIRFARERYETVIIDTPPIGLVVDATIVARHCDAGIMVVRYAATSQRVVRASLRELERTEVPIYGVLNMVARAESYGRYGDYRGYYERDAA
jgi:succinoglycan biosynthesis transport protein ExoP